MNRNIRLFESRYRQIAVIVLILMAILAVRLFVVTILQHDRWTSEASDQNTKTIYTSAPRGNIYDRNGNALAVNRQVFTVNFNASSLTTEEINNSSLKLINTLIKNGDKYTDNFPIKITSSGKFYYTYKQKITSWLKEQGFSTSLTAEEAFKRLCTRYGIEYDESSRFEIMDELQEKYNQDPPISVRNMEYTYDQELENFLSKFGIFSSEEIEQGISAEDAFRALRENYEIDESLSDKEARKIFIVRNEIATNGFTRYMPIKIASDISDETIAYIEEASIPGVEISSESERYYPNGSVACHILGYMGSISESEAEYYVDELGYSASDLVGKDGIEAALEEKLHGTPGEKKIRVNSSGEYVETVGEEKEAQKGSDVYLTIDLDLQKAAEKSLKSAIQKSENSGSGAVVAIDVETGDVLAMASYPTYDPNIFASGISEKAWKSVQAENPRDAFSPAPLYNNATRAAIQPGSTFKPITAITALEKGLDPYSQIQDRGVIEYGDREYACSSWNDYGGTHGYENLEYGIGNSCNYYFYCIATGKDWGTGAGLGYSITVDDILETAEKFGLADKTGIEIGENVADPPSAEYKMEVTKLGIRDYLYNNAHKFFTEEAANDYERLRKNLYTIADWADDNPSYDELITLLDENTDVKKSQLETVAARVKFDYYIQAQWGVGDQFNISIGQGDNAYTPLQMANYVATLGNGGMRNQVSIVSGVEGEGATVKEKAVDLGLKESTVEEVIKGMKRVCTSGTLSGVFANFPVEVAGKTGTAENQSIRQPKSEVSYVKSQLSSLNAAAGTSVSWSKVKKTMEQMMEEEPERYPSEDETVDEALIKASGYKITQSMINSGKGSYDYNAWTIAMAPADNPKIAVAVLLIEGGYSSNAAPVARDVIAAYLDVYDEVEPDTTRTDMNGKNKAQ
ncbi:MAG: peptidoglycan D,D-transpeptidase FtsI family protein [Emergencia sp.]